MPTKKGKSKPAKARKTAKKVRKSPKRGVTGRRGVTRRVSTGRVTATGGGAGMSNKAAEPATGPNPGSQTFRGPAGVPDRKAGTSTPGASEGGERIRDL